MFVDGPPKPEPQLTIRRILHPGVYSPTPTLSRPLIAGILLVYDITNEQSFKNIEEWLKNIEKHTSQPVNKILIGLRPS